MAELTLQQIRQAKEEAQTDIANYVRARLERLTKDCGVQPLGLSISMFQHRAHGSCDGLLVTDVSIDMGGI